MESHGGVNEELTVRVSRAAAVFGALNRSVFSDGSLSISTKSIVYKAVVLGVLLYAVKTWPIEQRELHSLEVFHHCLRKMGMPVPLSNTISSHRLRWLGHLL